eukprot:scaffold467_cov403-Prasinococcus_capsulatus_cf.AAC.20
MYMDGARRGRPRTLPRDAWEPAVLFQSIALQGERFALKASAAAATATFREGVTATDVQTVGDMLRALPQTIPQIVKYEFGPDAKTGFATHHYAVRGEFASVEDFTVYQKHDKHTEFVAFLKELVVDGSRAAVQMWVD